MKPEMFSTLEDFYNYTRKHEWMLIEEKPYQYRDHPEATRSENYITPQGHTVLVLLNDEKVVTINPFD